MSENYARAVRGGCLLATYVFQRQRSTENWRHLTLFALVIVVCVELISYELIDDIGLEVYLPLLLMFLAAYSALHSKSLVVQTFLLSLSIPVLLDVVQFYSKLNEFDPFGWNSIRDFEGTWTQGFSAFGKAAMAVILIQICAHTFGRIGLLNPSAGATLETHFLARQSVQPIEEFIKQCRFTPYVNIAVAIIGFGGLLLMDSLGIGTPGYVPAHLPFKLVGILTYTMLFLPILLGAFIYYRPPGLTLSFLIISLPALAGLTTASRTFVLAWSIPVVVLLLKRCRPTTLIWCFTSLLVALQATILVRTFKFSYAATTAVGGNGEDMPAIHARLAEVLGSIGQFPGAALSIFRRISNTQEIVLASNFNWPVRINEWSATFGLFIQSIDPYIGHDEWHMLWFGMVPPEEFWAGPGTLGRLVMMANLGPVFITAAASVTAIILLCVQRLLTLIFLGFPQDLFIAIQISAGIFLSIFIFNSSRFPTLIWMGVLLFCVAVIVLKRLLLHIRVGKP